MQPYVTNEQLLDAHTPAPDAPAPDVPATMPANDMPPPDVPAPDALATMPAPDVPPRLSKFRLSAVLPAIFMTVFGAMGLLLGLAPSMQVNDVLFGSGSAMQSTLYDFGTSSSAAVIGSLVTCTLLAGMGILFALLPRLKWRKIASKLPIHALLSVLSAGACFASFVSACVMIQEISDTDKSFSGGLGMLSAGAGTICIVVFSLLFLLAALGAFLWRRYLAKTYPALSAWEQAENARFAKKYATSRYADLSDEEKLATRLKRILWFNRIQPCFFAAALVLFIAIALMVIASLAVILMSIENENFEIMDTLDNIVSIVSSNCMWISILLFLFAICRLIFVRKVKQKNGTEISLAKVKKRNLKYSILFGILFLPTLAAFIACFFLLGITTQAAPNRYFSESNWGAEMFGFIVFAIYVVFIALLFSAILCFIFSLCAYKDCKRIAKALPAERAPFTVEELNNSKEVKSTYVLKYTSLAGMGALSLVFALMMIIPFQTTIFRENKVNAIAAGDSEVRVEQVLGEADEVKGTVWLYFTPNYLNYSNQMKKLNAQYEAALLSGDLDKIDLIEKNMNALEDKLKKSEGYYYIRVSYAGGAVRNVEVIRVYYYESALENKSGWEESSVYSLIPS